MVIFPGQPG